MRDFQHTSGTVSSLTPKRIVLIGPMASGKTSIGRHLAKLLGWRFADTDLSIEEKAGVDITTLFELEGESGFRKREHAQLEALGEETKIVVATGGGIVLMPENHPLLTRDSFVVLTIVSRDRQLARARKLKNRPLLLNGEPQKVLEETWNARQALYYALADSTLDTTHGSPRELAARLYTHLSRRLVV